MYYKLKFMKKNKWIEEIKFESKRKKDELEELNKINYSNIIFDWSFNFFYYKKI